MPSQTNRSTLIVLVLIAFDVLCVAAASLVATYGMWQGAVPFLEVWQLRWLYPVSFLVAWPIAAVNNMLFVIRRRDDLWTLTYDVLRSCALTLVFAGFVAAYGSRSRGTEPDFLVAFGLTAFLLLAGYRVTLQIALWSLRTRGRDERHVLIVGANERSRELVRTMRTNPHFGYHIVGLLDDDPDRRRMFESYKVPYLGKFDTLEATLIRHVVDEVYLCLPVRSRYETLHYMAQLCEGVGVGVRIIADLLALRIATSRFERLSDIPIIAFTTVPESQAKLIMQRLTDIVVSALAILALSPIFIGTAILVKLDSRGPVFFAQERVGLNRRRFKMLKFRSMVANAEALRAEVEAYNEADGPIFKARRDPRVTRVGRFIRKYSIDELPQLFNVLLGHMSLVGPRPPLPKEVAQYSWNDRRRLSIRPGMTGLSQVSGRSDLSFRDTVDLDLYYIDKWSLGLVFQILVRTVPAVLRGRGAV